MRTCWRPERRRTEQNDCSKGLLKGEAGSVAADEPNAGSDLDRRIETGHRMAGQQFELGNDEKTGVSMKRAKPLRKNSLTGEVGQEFIINNPFLFYLFTFGTELGNEMFFIVFFPFLMWNVDAFVSRQLIVVWIWNLFFGQCAKDLIRWTRPTSPPVVKVEIFYNLEYSMPSTHAMSGTAIPFCLFLLTYGRWQVNTGAVIFKRSWSTTSQCSLHHWTPIQCLSFCQYPQTRYKQTHITYPNVSPERLWNMVKKTWSGVAFPKTYLQLCCGNTCFKKNWIEGTQTNHNSIWHVFMTM